MPVIVTCGDAVFPAPAGVILIKKKKPVRLIGFPRTCGGDPECLDTRKFVGLFSPHLRG